MKLLDLVRQQLRAGHYAKRTEQAYFHWIERYTRWQGIKHPAAIEGAKSCWRMHRLR